MTDSLEFDRQISEMEELIAVLKSPQKRDEAREQGIDLETELATLETQLRDVMTRRYSRLTPWEKTLVARHKDRPYALDYIRSIFDEFVELSGDRYGSNDEAVVGGLARLGDRPVVVIGQQKGRDLRERQRRNFGCASAGGFRKALRLARLAEKFGRPLISFIDTAGAAADLGAEQAGVSAAIAENLREFSSLATPIVVVVIGEGGSGGAIGMAVGDRILMLEHAVYSVISPEGCAAILWHDKEQASRAADALKLTAQGALDLGFVDAVLPEPPGGAHRDPISTADTVKRALAGALKDLSRFSIDDLLAARYARIRGVGVWNETETEGGGAAIQ
jgi:acetyl-CoA carboxylase carboxyl transferase subunit alpha